jgi:hypothetical protein
VDRHLGQVSKIPVHRAHVGDPGRQRGQVVIRIPGRIQILVRLCDPALSYLLLRVCMGIRKDPYKTKEKDKRMLPEEISL